MTTISSVYVWGNGMVMVFDECGQQMPDYQGPVEDVRDKILADAPETAKFYAGHWRGNVQETTRGVL